MRNTGSNPLISRAARALGDMHRFYFEHPEESWEDDALLCHIADLNARGVRLCITDLVRTRYYGTLPTLTSRLARMLRRGLVRQVTDTDRRIRLLECTPHGLGLLQQRCDLIEAALAADGTRRD